MNPPNPSQIATLPGAFSKSWQWPKAIKSIDLASDVATHNAVLSSCTQSSSWSQVGGRCFCRGYWWLQPPKKTHPWQHNQIVDVSWKIQGRGVFSASMFFTSGVRSVGFLLFFDSSNVSRLGKFAIYIHQGHSGLSWCIFHKLWCWCTFHKLYIGKFDWWMSPDSWWRFLQSFSSDLDFSGTFI